MPDNTGLEGLVQAGSLASPSKNFGAVSVALFAALMGVGIGITGIAAAAIYTSTGGASTTSSGWAWGAIAVGLTLTGIAAAVGVIAAVRQRQARGALLRAADDGASAQTAFVTNMSHELRTPLNGILGYAELLAGDLALTDDRSGRRHWVAGIQRNGQHLLSVITDLLDLARIESGKLNVAREQTSPAAIIEDVLSMLRVRAHEKGLLLEAQIADSVPPHVVTDRLHLRQILLTIVGNAVKFTEKGGVSIRASMTPGLPPTMRFEVWDTGIGIAPEAMPHLFRPFAQADSSASRKYGGMGLGLSISKRLAQMLGGDITVQSEPGKGSVFALTITPEIPVAEAKAAPASEPSEAALPASLHPQPLRGVRILVAEDGRENQFLISHHLNKAGATVTIAENGRLAVEAVGAEGPPHFELVLMDMQMPEMDGYTATRVLRARGYTLPIVALTAHAMVGDREKCLAAGCSDYATKPIDKATLIAVCCRALGMKEEPASHV